MSDIGHNHGIDDAVRKDLKERVARIETLESEKAGIAEDVKAEFVSAKAAGFDVKVLRAVIKRRKQDKDDLEEFEALLDAYMRVFG